MNEMSLNLLLSLAIFELSLAVQRDAIGVNGFVEYLTRLCAWNAAVLLGFTKRRKREGARQNLYTDSYWFVIELAK